MKRCPNCGSTYTNDLQKFCTKDGSALVDAQTPSAGQGETIRIDSAQLNSSQLNDDEPTKVISRELPAPPPAAFDPYKTVINPRQDTSAALPRNTQDLTPATATPPTSQPLPPSTSGPIQPPPSGSLPLSSSGPIQPPSTPSEIPPPASGPISTPLPSAPAPMPPATAAPRPAKKSKLPLVLGILFVIFVIGIVGLGALYWFVGKPWLESRRVVVTEPTRPQQEPTPIVESTPRIENTKPAKEVPPYSAPTGAVQFVNSDANLDGKLKEHYVDFSFYYPDSWEKDPKAGVPGASNFVKVEKSLPGAATQENFAVGWYSSAGSEEGDRAVFHSLAENLSAQYEKNFPEYRKVSEGPTKVGVYDGYQFRFESVSRNTDKGDIKIWGRVIFLPPVDGGKNGVTLLMLATSLAHELRSVNDVGVKGDLPMMLESFRFGKTQ
jgi:hypothetical protein